MRDRAGRWSGRVRLRVGITTAYLAVMVPLTLGIVVLFYLSISSLILSTTDDLMRRTTESIVRDVRSMVLPVRQLVEGSAEIVGNDLGRLRQVQGLRYFHQQVTSLPQVYGLYIGYEATGDFYQVIQVPPELTSWGPSGRPFPDGVRSGVRLLDDSSGARADSFILYGDWGEVLQVDRGPPTFDPRHRPWYVAVEERAGTVFSDPYVFSSSGLVGVTVSKAVRSQDGLFLGVVGADITLATVSTLLRSEVIGENGRIFLVDQDGHLLAHPGTDFGARGVARAIALTRASQAGDPLIAKAVTLRDRLGSDGFEAPLGPEDTAYRVAFQSFDNGFGQIWSVGVLVERSELLKPLEDAALRSLLFGGLAMLVALVAVSMLSKVLSRPLQDVAAETQRIRAFDLSGDFTLRSMFIEVAQLVEGVRTMKHSLRRFSSYVPRELVRAIVSSEDEGAEQVRRQPLTVMFTDIRGFTRTAEDLAPELLVRSLSAYFAVMSDGIHRHGGVVDKYIGDAIMALWNAPRAAPDHAACACLAALSCRAEGRLLAAREREAGRPAFRTRFGLHTGDAVVGSVGAPDRVQYSAFGGMVNLASRLEALNKLFGTDILVSGDLAAAADEDVFVFRTLDSVVVAGTSRPLAVRELIGTRGAGSAFPVSDADLERVARWDDCYALVEAHGWAEAARALALYHRAYPDDAAAPLLRDRCMAYAREPSGQVGDGARHMPGK